MIFHENRLPADDSHEIPCLICYFWKSIKVWNCLLLQIIGGALRVNTAMLWHFVNFRTNFHFLKPLIYVTPTIYHSYNKFDSPKSWIVVVFMCGFRRFCQRVSNSTTTIFFLFCFVFLMRERWSKLQSKWGIMDPPAKRYYYCVLLADQWWPNIECWFCRFVLLQGIRINNCWKSYFVVFQGASRSGPQLDPRIVLHLFEKNVSLCC